MPLKQFKIRRRPDNFWVAEDPEAEALARFPHDDISSVEQIRYYLFAAVNEAMPDVYGLHWPIEQLRAEAFVKIDMTSDELFARGFTFEDTIFSITVEAQVRYATMMMLADALAYPLGINSLDDTSTLYLQNADHTRAFCLTALGFVKGIVDSGTVQKEIVRALDDEQALGAFVDPRLPPTS